MNVALPHQSDIDMSLSKAGKLPLYIPNPVQRVAREKQGPIEELALHEGESTLTQLSMSLTLHSLLTACVLSFKVLRWAESGKLGQLGVQYMASTPSAKASAQRPGRLTADRPAAPCPVILLYFALTTCITYGSLHPYACTYH